MTEAVGGTSLATPITAAEAAVAQQRAGQPLGFLNPALYAAAKEVHDVVPSTTRRAAAARDGSKVYLATIDRDSSLALRTGWDPATGLGTISSTTIAALGRHAGD